ncbi:hypothetical protein [Dictyobacter aurantiacus]|uniref:Uncharacterized protein n=1 Tax=Dictyobacter aurantiacus TaxID=1936993 RepID=A0A401ZLU0_9CHLR|nr:hypothetical protein [Dictyobacter aurantiacus]GCE07851.1 hypothetical protein KDAU_51800 [Dictyobacter aurantiacus]
MSMKPVKPAWERGCIVTLIGPGEHKGVSRLSWACEGMVEPYDGGEEPVQCTHLVDVWSVAGWEMCPREHDRTL